MRALRRLVEITLGVAARVTYVERCCIGASPNRVGPTPTVWKRDVSVLRNSGSTKLNLPAYKPGATDDPLLAAVQDAAAGEFVVLGEIGRAPTGVVGYLARDTKSRRLVVLRLTAGSAGDYLLEVVTEIDTSVPAPPTECPRCRAPVRGWGKFCTQCGGNLWSDRAAGAGRNKDDLLAAVKDATQGRFEILGEMSRSGGGGIVYFARDLESGKIEALRLQQETAGDFSIGLTGVLQRFAQPIAGYKPPRRGGGGSS